MMKHSGLHRTVISVQVLLKEIKIRQSNPDKPKGTKYDSVQAMHHQDHETTYQKMLPADGAMNDVMGGEPANCMDSGSSWSGSMAAKSLAHSAPPSKESAIAAFRSSCID
jgi:hypothetical protein